MQRTENEKVFALTCVSIHDLIYAAIDMYASRWASVYDRKKSLALRDSKADNTEHLSRIYGDALDEIAEMFNDIETARNSGFPYTRIVIEERTK